MKQTIQNLFKTAGISINGENPWDIKVHNPGFYSRVLAGGSLALGESYMDGWWDCEALDQFFNKVLSAALEKKVKDSKRLLWDIFKARLTNPQKRSRAHEIGKRHYDMGNDLFKHMLDKRMTYSCGYWEKYISSSITIPTCNLCNIGMRIPPSEKSLLCEATRRKLLKT